MKLYVYGMRPFDELEFFEAACAEHGIELGHTPKPCTASTAELATGSQVVSVNTQLMDAALLGRLHLCGVKAVATRSIGVDHIDFEAARTLGLGVSHAIYDPESVADYAIMLLFMLLRRMPQTLDRSRVQDYTLRGKIGRDIRACTIGIVGTGRIGTAVLQRLSGFGCTLLAFDERPNDTAARVARYVDLDELLQTSDGVSLHAPATAANHHLLDARAFGRMKPGALLVNTARGSLVDTWALIDALEQGVVGGAALDVLEQEDNLLYRNHVGAVLPHRALAILRSFPNVILTPHTAFYTDVDVRQMAFSVVQGAWAMMSEQPSRLVVLRPSLQKMTPSPPATPTPAVPRRHAG